MKIKDQLKIVQKSQKLKNGGFEKMRIQLENVNENSIRKFKWKFKLEMAKSPFRNWKESSWKLENLEIMKDDKWLINKQNKSPFRNWKESSWK